MAAIYADYTRDRTGPFFGLTLRQLAAVVVTGLPVLVAINRHQWPAVLGLAGVWGVAVILVVVPIRGRSATGWLMAALRFSLGTVTRWTSWRSRAANGQVTDPDEPDLPGVLHAIRVHDGPPQGPLNTRFAIIQDHASQVWAATAALTHPGLALADDAERTAQATGLTTLLNACARTELVSELHLLVRSVPDDGAERQQWLATHQAEQAPPLARTVNEQLADMLTRASVRTETFVTVVVPEHRLARRAKEFGRGVNGRARALYQLMGEVEQLLLGGMRASSVSWLTSPELAVAVRSGFAPGDRLGVVAAHAARERDASVNDTVPWSQAGPAGAELAVRHYSHDAWQSISATLTLPAKGAGIGALAAVVVPSAPAERRSLVCVFPILQETVADRQTQNAEWMSDMGQELRNRAGVKTRAKDRTQAARTSGFDARMNAGHALVRPYAVACVTAPAHLPITEFGGRLDASIRQAGFAPLRLDMAQDAGFAAATLPLGVGLHRGRGSGS